MDKSTSAEEIIDLLRRRGIKDTGDINPNCWRPNTDPCLEFIKNYKKIYILMCEAGIKEAKYPEVLWFGFGLKLQGLVDIKNTFFVVVDNLTHNTKFILGKFDETDWSYDQGGRAEFNFKRPEYENFFNTSSLVELVNEMLKLCPTIE